MKRYTRLTAWITVCTVLLHCSHGSTPGVDHGRGISTSIGSSGSTSRFLRSLSGALGSHDPTLAIEKGIWYAFQTGAGIDRKKSHDGLLWEPAGSVFKGKANWWQEVVPGQVGYDVWAPDVEVFNGRVWLYYAISTFGSQVSVIGLASASSLADADWQDEGVVITSDASVGYNAIDPHLFIDLDDTPWLAFGSWWSGIKLTRLDRQTMKPVGDITALASRGGGIEAPALFYHDGNYFLFVSVGRCCAGVNSSYQIRYARAASLAGPYFDKRGIAMTEGGGSLLWDGDDRWIGPGGQDVYAANMLSFHAYDAMNDGNATLCMAELRWDDEGWPFL